MTKEELLKECTDLVLHYDSSQDRIMHHLGFVNSSYPQFDDLVAYIKEWGWESPFGAEPSIYILTNKTPSEKFIALWHSYLEWNDKVNRTPSVILREAIKLTESIHFNHILEPEQKLREELLDKLLELKEKL